jgi:hypothetical protein
MAYFHELQRLSVLTAILACALFAPWAATTRAQPIAELLEDNAAILLPKLTNPTGDPGKGYVETQEIFSGKSGVKIVPMQRFEPTIPGWNYHIVEKPGPGEYRYVRFAWKADGCLGIMLQFHDEKDWNIRYTAGLDMPGWGSKQVAAAPPERWVIVTRDLFADFGQRTITGIALTAFEGKAGYFDHIYFGRTIDDLDRIDATGVRQRGVNGLTPGDLEQLWDDLCRDDAAIAYRAFWTLVAAPELAAPFLKEKTRVLPSATDLPARIRKWIAELESDDPHIRDRASDQLARHVDSAADLLRREAESAASPEVRDRAASILRDKNTRGPWPDAAQQAAKSLRFMGTPESRHCLEDLAKGAEGSPATCAAKSELERALMSR